MDRYIVGNVYIATVGGVPNQIILRRGVSEGCADWAHSAVGAPGYTCSSDREQHVTDIIGPLDVSLPIIRV